MFLNNIHHFSLLHGEREIDADALRCKCPPKPFQDRFKSEHTNHLTKLDNSSPKNYTVQSKRFVKLSFSLYKNIFFLSTLNEFIIWFYEPISTLTTHKRTQSGSAVTVGNISMQMFKRNLKINVLLRITFFVNHRKTTLATSQQC